MTEQEVVRDCCPICGYQFEEVKDINICPVEHYFQQIFSRSELITDSDDYMWCQ